METNKTILQMKYGRIVKAFAKEAGISLDEALDKFYNSNTFILMDEGIADSLLRCYIVHILHM